MSINRVEQHCGLLLSAAGAVIEDYRCSPHRSDYVTLRCGGRQVTLRGSDHHNFPNPRSQTAARSAHTLRYTAAGFERALALWLGWDESQVAGLKLATKRDQAILVKKDRTEVFEA